MAYTHHDLRLKTLAELKEIAAGIDHEAVKGFTQMNKLHLIAALSTALGIDVHEHHTAHGLDKADVKLQIRALKRQRDQLLGAHDSKKLKPIRTKIRRLKHRLRKAAD